jgi:hypothetical protein
MDFGATINVITASCRDTELHAAYERSGGLICASSWTIVILTKSWAKKLGYTSDNVYIRLDSFTLQINNCQKHSPSVAQLLPSCQYVLDQTRKKRAFLEKDLVVHLSSRPAYRITTFKYKKAVPHHTYGGARGRGLIAPTHSRSRYYIGVSDQRHALAVIYSSGKYPRYPLYRRLGSRAELEIEARGKILCLCWGSNLDSPVVQSVVRHYTD